MDDKLLHCDFCKKKSGTYIVIYDCRICKKAVSTFFEDDKIVKVEFIQNRTKC